MFLRNSLRLRMSEQQKSPTLFRNYISFAGAMIVIAAVVSILLLFLIELSQTADNPYLGIVTYVILPSFLIFGLLVIVTGMWLERRRRIPEVTYPVNFSSVLCFAWERHCEQCRRNSEQDFSSRNHSITLSARNSRSCMVSPSAFAVFMLMTSSNFVGCSTGMSPGFAPLRILST